MFLTNLLHWPGGVNILSVITFILTAILFSTPVIKQTYGVDLKMLRVSAVTKLFDLILSGLKCKVVLKLLSHA